MLKFSRRPSFSFIAWLGLSVLFVVQPAVANEPLQPGDKVRYFDGYLKVDVVIQAIHPNQTATVEFAFASAIGGALIANSDVKVVVQSVIKTVEVSKLRNYQEVQSIENLRVGDLVRVDHEGGVPTFDARILKLFSDGVAFISYANSQVAANVVGNVSTSSLVAEVAADLDAENSDREFIIGEAMHYERPDQPTKDVTIQKLFTDGSALVRYVVQTKDGKREVAFPQSALVRLSQLRHRQLNRHAELRRCPDIFRPVVLPLRSLGQAFDQ